MTEYEKKVIKLLLSIKDEVSLCAVCLFFILLQGCTK